MLASDYASPRIATEHRDSSALSMFELCRRFAFGSTKLADSGKPCIKTEASNPYAVWTCMPIVLHVLAGSLEQLLLTEVPSNQPPREEPRKCNLKELQAQKIKCDPKL